MKPEGNASMGVAMAAFVEGVCGGDGPLAAATLEAVAGGADRLESGCARSLRAIARAHGVPWETLRRHVKEVRDRAEDAIGRAVSWALAQGGSRVNVVWADISHLVKYLASENYNVSEVPEDLEDSKAMMSLFMAEMLSSGDGSAERRELYEHMERMTRKKNPSWKSLRLPEDVSQGQKSTYSQEEGAWA